MNERIEQLAKQIGAVRNVMAMGRDDGVLFTEFELEKFAALVAAAEREACIKAVEKVGQHGIVTQCAAAIRYKKHDIGLSEERDRVWTQAHWTEYERSIAAVEREACAKLCDEIAIDMWKLYKGRPPYKGDEEGRASDFT